MGIVSLPGQGSTTTGNPVANAPASGQPTIPNWPWPKGFDPNQQKQLIDLSNAGELSGIPPQIIAYMQQAESGFGYNAGGAINSAGYGGYFGLGNNKTYNAGTATTAILHGTDPFSYAAQAIIAASAFAAYMIPAGGNYIAAENIYQTGQANSSANGAGIFQQYGITSKTSGVQNLPNNPVTDIGSAAIAAGGAAAGIFGDLTAPWTYINNAINDVVSGFGIGWKGVLGIILGIAFIGFGIVFLFHTEIKRGASEVAAAAPEAAA